MVAFVLCNHTGRLFQKYIVDAWCKVEEYKLSWFKINQKSIRADLYKVCTHQPNPPFKIKKSSDNFSDSLINLLMSLSRHPHWSKRGSR
jgi:hypothetical protein